MQSSLYWSDSKQLGPRHMLLSYRKLLLLLIRMHQNASNESLFQNFPVDTPLQNIFIFLAATKQLYEWYFLSVCLSVCHTFLPLSPPGWRGIVVTVWVGGRAGGCQTCGTHISVTAWRIFSIRSYVELSGPVDVHYHGQMPICPIWACPWAKNLSNLPQIGSRLCGTHISETAGWIYPI